MDKYRLEARDAGCGRREGETGAAAAYLLSEEEVARYHREGFLFRQQLFSAEEMALFFSTVKSDPVVTGRSHTRKDSDGFYSKLSLWNHLGVNMYGAVARCARIVDNVETLLGGWSHGVSSAREEAYHYHSKVMIKEPRVGGAWEWHQDYGYWYNNGCLLPRMISVMLAVDRHSEENGCLQVLSGSHSVGRINHSLTGDQAGADPSRVAQCLSRYKKVPVLCEPGDVLFLHCNTLHASAQNRSPQPRWSLICCYNARSNDPYTPHHHPTYTPMDRWPDRAVLDLRGVGISEGDGTVFMDPEEDLSAKKKDLKP